MDRIAHGSTRVLCILVPTEYESRVQRLARVNRLSDIRRMVYERFSVSAR